MAFQFVPAGLKMRAFGGMSVHTKYHARNRGNGFSIKSQSKGHIWVDTQDRELFIADQSMTATGQYPTGFDECTNLSHFHAHSGKDLGLEYIMINYTDHLTRDLGMAVRKTSALGKGTGIIVDSGGFQISRGDMDFIDPEEEIEWYNRNADLGMLLDIPTHDDALAMRAAKIQREVIKLWLKKKRPDLELINILHGSGDTLKQYLEVVDHPKIRRLAFGGMFFVSMMQTIEKIVETVLDTPDYLHHHVLGVTHRGVMILLMYMAKVGLSPLITCDSSSALQLSCYRTLYMYHRVEESIFMQDMGEKGNYLAGQARLPCNCPVCSTLVYADTFRNLKGDIPDALVCMHNVYTFNDWAQHMNKLVMSESKDAIKKSLEQQFTVGYGAQVVKTLKAGLDYIDYAKEHGAAKARQKFNAHFPHQSKLFTRSLGVDDIGGEEDYEEELSHTELVLQTYEELFGLT